MKIDKVFWFHFGARDEAVGILRVTDEITGERRAYIGIASGTGERRDLAEIVLHGDKFPVDAAWALGG